MQYSYSSSFSVIIKTFIYFGLFSVLSPLSAQNYHWAKATNNPIELGEVHWLRNLDEAKVKANTTQKPIFILFQEVPGCNTCQRYGQNILSHPLLVEAIESYFVPLAIHNNKGGHDKTVLRKFNEPAWNNPVVRITSAQGKDIIPRVSAKYDLLSVTSATLTAITASGQIIPKYLSLLETELQGSRYDQEAFLSMYCFWTGEKEIAKIPGVVKTEAGFMDGREVVKVNFNGSVTSLKNVIKEADKNACAQKVYVSDKSNIKNSKVHSAKSFTKDKESKYYLYKSKYSSIPMMDHQAMLVNSWIGQNRNPEELLSPRQLTFLGAKKKNLIGLDFVSAWHKALN